jgi:hypothetical protein
MMKTDPAVTKSMGSRTPGERRVHEGDATAVDEQEEAVALEEREREAEPARVAVQLLLALLAFLAERFELGEDHGAELHDDRRVDVRRETEEREREVIDGAAREGSEHAEKTAAVPSFEVLAERERVGARDREVRDDAVHDQYACRDHDAAAQILGVPDLTQILKHRLAGGADDGEGAAGLRDGLFRGFARCVDLELELLRDTPLSEDLHEVALAHEALLLEIGDGVGTGVERFERGKIHHFVLLGARRLETAELGLATDERHLAAFEAVLAAFAHAGVLAFRTATRGRTAAGAIAAADALARLA